MDKKGNLKEIAALFFKLGMVAFGGPAAHIAMMEREVVEKRKWMSHDHFLDLIGATNLIPGPNSTEMTMHCGHERGGFWGLFVAGFAFIFPATVTTGILAYFYVTYGKLPEVEVFIIGIQPAVLSIIAAAIFKLGKKALKNIELGILGILVVLASFLGINEIAALLLAGIVGGSYFYLRNKRNLSSFIPFWLTGILPVKLNTTGIFLTFLKVGAVLYGSGYVLVAYLDSELVGRGWLSRQELLDAIAIGQFTPGPVLSTATFVGFQLDGLSGAIAATAGIFLPSFILVLILNPFIPKLRKSVFVGYLLDSLNVGAVGVMMAVLLQMGLETIVDWRMAVIAILSFIITFKFKKVSAVWIVVGGSMLGYLLHFL